MGPSLTQNPDVLDSYTKRWMLDETLKLQRSGHFIRWRFRSGRRLSYRYSTGVSSLLNPRVRFTVSALAVQIKRPILFLHDVSTSALMLTPQHRGPTILQFEACLVQYIFDIVYHTLPTVLGTSKCDDDNLHLESYLDLSDWIQCLTSGLARIPRCNAARVLRLVQDMVWSTLQSLVYTTC
jgi:hypothetical protein